MVLHEKPLGSLFNDRIVVLVLSVRFTQGG
jgi:hypothetical protein